jgi:predicted RNA-binding Zn ribbon-like protein
MSAAAEPSPEPSYAEKLPKAIAGVLCLDFVNTVTWRGDPTRQAERLTSYGELVLWSRSLGTLNPKTADALLAAAKRAPKAAETVRQRALALRHEIEHLFDPTLTRPTKTPVLDALTREIGRAGRLVPGKGWQPATAAPDLTLPLLPVVVSVLALATAPQQGRARSCADPQCSWMFLDESKNQTRQWCSMEDCGNRAKARAHYARCRGSI